MFIDINNNSLTLGDLVLLNFPFNKNQIQNSYALIINEFTVYTFEGLKVAKNDNIYCYLIKSPSENEILITNKLLEFYLIYNHEKEKKLSNSDLNYSLGSILKFDSKPFKRLYLGDIELVNMKTSDIIRGFCYVDVDNIYPDVLYNLFMDNIFKRKSNLLYETNCFFIRNKPFKTYAGLLAEIDVRHLNNKIIDIWESYSNCIPYKIKLLEI